MPVYAIGDIQGCFDELQRALDSINYDPAQDQLWFVGDLVNRGPKSLETLRFVRSLGSGATTVLGNHDLHLLALAAGNLRKAGADTLQPILQAADRQELLDWLRHQPLLHYDQQLGFAMVHAGLPPAWSIAQALQYAREVENVLQSARHPEFFEGMYGNQPNTWSEQLQGMDRWRFITNCFTRLRFCTADGQLLLEQKGPPESQPEATAKPWFEHPQRVSRNTRLVFGHWSTLGYRQTDNIWAIDSGCLWGGQLTLLKLDTEQPKPYHFACPGAQDPLQF